MRGAVYILNTEADSGTVLDGRQMRLLTTIPVGDYPIGISLNDKMGQPAVKRAISTPAFLT